MVFVTAVDITLIKNCLQKEILNLRLNARVNVQVINNLFSVRVTLDRNVVEYEMSDDWVSFN